MRETLRRVSNSKNIFHCKFRGVSREDCGCQKPTQIWIKLFAFPVALNSEINMAQCSIIQNRHHSRSPGFVLFWRSGSNRICTLPSICTNFHHFWRGGINLQQQIYATFIRPSAWFRNKIRIQIRVGDAEDEGNQFRFRYRPDRS